MISVLDELSFRWLFDVKLSIIEYSCMRVLAGGNGVKVISVGSTCSEGATYRNAGIISSKRRSMTSRKNIGDRTEPCLTPLEME